MSDEVQPIVPKSVKRRLLKLAHLFVSFGVGIAVVLGIGLWRLSQGPVSLDYLTPALERTFSVRGTPFAVHVDKTLLIWGGWQRFADLRLRNLRLFGPDGKMVALFPDVSIGLSLQALLQRRLALSRIEIHGLTATVERSADGHFEFELPVTSGGDTSDDTILQDATDVIMRLVRTKEGPLRDLRRVAVIGARLRYIDRALDQVWTFPEASFAADLTVPGIEAKLALLLEMDGKRTLLSGAALYDRKSGRTGGRVDFDSVRPHLLARAVPKLKAISALGFPVSGNAKFEFAKNLSLMGLRLDLRSPVGGAVLEMAYPPAGETVSAVAQLDDLNIAALARSTPALAPLAGLDVPVNGRIAGSMAGDGQIRVTHLDLTAGAGQIEAPGVFAEPLAVAGARLRAVIAPDLSKAEIHEAKIDLGGSVLGLTAKVRQVRDDYRVQAAFQTNGLSVRDLGRYWPDRIAAGARQWVRENIAAGAVRKANGDFVLRVPRSAPAEAVVESVNGSFSYEDLNIRYWSPLPPVTDVGGTAIFDKGTLRFTVTEGHLRDVAVEQGAVDITGLDGGEEKIAIELGLRGAARTILGVLDRPPLRYAADIGIQPDAVRGDAIVRGRIAFPLGDGFSRQRIAVKVSARVRNVGLKPAPYGLAVDGGDIAIDADRTKLKLTGDIQLGAMPVSVEWHEKFGDDGTARRVVLSGRVANFGNVGFGLPEFDFISGPGDAKVEIRTAQDSASEVVADFDLAAAALSVPYLGWRKPAGTPGHATLRMKVGKSKAFSIDGFQVNAAQTHLEGGAALTENGTWRVRIDRFERPDSKFTGSIDLRSDRSVVAEIRGDRFDLASVLAVSPPTASRPGRPAAAPRRIKVNAQFSTLSWGPDRRIKDATLVAVRGSQGLDGLMLEGRTGPRGRLSVKYLPGPGGHVLDIKADDFGGALGAVLSTGKIARGSLVVRGYAGAPGTPLKGSFLAKNFVVRKAPTLARLLQVASLTGVVDALSKKGLAFDTFEGDFAHKDGRLTFAKARAYGSSIGITVSGDIDAARDRIRLRGTLVPAYTLNRIIGSIPVVGTLLTGGKDEGLFAATYRVTGPLDKPEVSVNPLSALAPGFLRNLFSGVAPDSANGSGVKPAE
jgi:uncharacterized protein YhdP